MLIGKHVLAGIFRVAVLVCPKRAVSVAPETTHGKQDLSIKRDQLEVSLLQHRDPLAGGRDTLPFHGTVHAETVDAVMVASVMAAVSSNVINVSANSGSRVTLHSKGAIVV